STGWGKAFASKPRHPTAWWRPSRSLGRQPSRWRWSCIPKSASTSALCRRSFLTHSVWRAAGASCVDCVSSNRHWRRREPFQEQDMHDTSFRSLDLFSPTYAIARGKFLNAASARGLAVDSHVLGLPSAEGETLAIDVVLDGPADASKMLIVLSGVHGVEGFCGSAIQTGLLGEGAPMPAGTAVLHVHAINPYGFSHLRRVTQENVDLNR